MWLIFLVYIQTQISLFTRKFLLIKSGLERQTHYCKCQCRTLPFSPFFFSLLSWYDGQVSNCVYAVTFFMYKTFCSGTPYIDRKKKIL